MLTRDQISALIPHKGSMCLLEEVKFWDQIKILCVTTSHLSPENPLKRNGRLSALAGVEYGAQATAIHGALINDQEARPGMLAGLRDIVCHVKYIDENWPELQVKAVLELGMGERILYHFSLSADEKLLVAGRVAVALQ
ncbi:MAG: hydroxymyristoyl-ACP dehydratase [Pseudomonadota bacterium]